MTLTQSLFIRHATDDDYYIQAVSAWQTFNNDGKHFAECCAMVDGRRTADLAADCKTSVDTIEQYRNAYRLYYRLEIDIESEQVRKLWKDATMELWKKAAQLWSRYNISSDKMLDYLQTASEHGMSRETFGAHVDEKENDVPKWIRRLQSVAKKLRATRDDWKSEMPIHLREKYELAVEQFATVLEEIANEADTENA